MEIRKCTLYLERSACRAPLVPHMEKGVHSLNVDGIALEIQFAQLVVGVAQEARCVTRPTARDGVVIELNLSQLKRRGNVERG